MVEKFACTSLEATVLFNTGTMEVETKENSEIVIEPDDSLDLVSNGISFSSGNNTLISKSSFSSNKDKTKSDDDPFRVKPSWIPDIRSQQEWDHFIETRVRNT